MALVRLTEVQPTTRVKTKVVASVGASLWSLSVQLSSTATAQYILIFDAVAAPSPGAVSIYPPIKISPDQTVDIDAFPDVPILGTSTGITVCLSTTETYTAPGTSDAYVHAWYTPITLT